MVRQDDLAAVPYELVVRSLRRRFWGALQEDNAARALRLYTATWQDWQAILMEEEEQQQQDKKNKKKVSKSSNIIPTFKKNRFGRRPRAQEGSSSAFCYVPPTKSSPILPLALKPTDFFLLDDMRHPTQDAYREIIVNQSAKKNNENNNDGGNGDSDNNVFAELREMGSANNNLSTLIGALDPESAAAAAASSSEGGRRKSWFGGRLSSSKQLNSSNNNGENEELALVQPPLDANRRTTPLHEAARLGHSDLLRYVLAQQSELDVNLKNGNGRTPLHNVAGGLTVKEATRTKSYQDDIAILALKKEANSEENEAAKSRRRSFVQQLQPRQQQQSSDDKRASLLQKKSQRLSSRRWKAVSMDRMDAANTLMALDASTNAVDAMGRTPLHYAAALGRSEMSVALFNTFGTLLTVVDSFSRTPAEWAALHSHKALAAQLEARALLFLDPLEMDLLEERMEQQQQSSTGGTALSPPFAWFTTLDMDRVEKEREFRVKVVLDRLEKILARLAVGQSARDLLMSNGTSLGDSSHQSSSSSEQAAHPPASESSSSAAKQKKQAGQQEYIALSTLSQSQVAQFLSYHNWDVKKTLTLFYEDPAGSLAKAEVVLPKPKDGANKEEEEEEEEEETKTEIQTMCLICCEEFDPSNTAEWRDLDTCDHGFCVECLGDYISDCARGRQHGLCIPCPHHECSVTMTQSLVLDAIPSDKVRQQLVEAANNNFVVEAKDFRFCPLPGCEHVVKFIPPKNKSGPVIEILSASGAVCCSPESHVKRKEGSPLVNYEGMYDECYYDCRAGVQPKRAHRFCFHCGEGAHWPVSCDLLEQWKNTVEEHVEEVQGDGGEGDVNEVSHKLWLKANTKPCPKCKAPIEKNEGCNHVTCSNPHCNHEFCWICQQDWNLHSTSTGGFFRCNRWADQGDEHQYYDKAPAAEELVTPTDEDLSDPRRMRHIYGTAMHETRIKRKKARETARFIHHYQRYSAHSDSMRLEGKMFDSCSERLKPTVLAAVEFSGDANFNFGGKGLSFVFDAFTELRECRSVLKYSYALSYFRYTGSRKRNQRRKLAESLAFEQIQSELEMLTEQMSDLVGRVQLRATQSQISYMTLTAAQKRRDFSSFMMRVLAKDSPGSQDNTDGSNNGEAGEDQEGSESAPDAQIIQGMPMPRTAPDVVAITGLAGNPRRTNNNQDYQSPRLVMMDPVQESLQALRENTGNALDTLLRLNTSYESNADDLDDDEEVYDDGAPRQWSCRACTYINTSGRFCEMCGQASSS